MKITRNFGMLNHNWDIYITVLFQGSGIYVKKEVGEFQGCELMNDTKEILVSRRNSQIDSMQKSSTTTSQTKS